MRPKDKFSNIKKCKFENTSEDISANFEKSCWEIQKKSGGSTRGSPQQRLASVLFKRLMQQNTDFFRRK
ncbi:MAG TPA: hypothetical protein DCM19_02585 [Parasutterella excrementihominis]|uniref:Uncharacterized protein n=1 Tax=Parasutterella excrementihominis YIT 11859 TaxID=762966 RepID=F3QN41_9BURK|nr:hypothetical protein HMPREF9439_02372 [Parasutterella excrementihominis YIT 11859]RHU70191.1 hypothetical protein DXC76_00820 [Burkholderiales bacterium]HAI60732.1 hypothetical protein [Parasutterella excrementihominis]HBZ27205.1 hypothetical protein [Parasutterella excrementihominis]